MKNPAPDIGTRIRRRRTGLGWSLDVTAGRTGVSKAMLGQIERGESSPTVGTLWKIATGLEISFSTLLGEDPPVAGPELFPAEVGSTIRDEDGIEAYTLLPFSPAMGFELMVVSLAPRSTHVSSAHAAGVVEHVIPIDGPVELRLDDRWNRVEAGRALRFAADQAHAYRNPGRVQVTFHNLIRYP